MRYQAHDLASLTIAADGPCMERENEPINGGLIEVLERFRLLNVLRSENQSTLVEVEGIPSGGIDASASNLLGKRRSGLVHQQLTNAPSICP